MAAAGGDRRRRHLDRLGDVLMRVAVELASYGMLVAMLLGAWLGGF